MAIGVDIRGVENEAEALALMLHHLRLAAAYFEATPEQLPEIASDDFSKPAIDAWLAGMEALYPKED